MSLNEYHTFHHCDENCVANIFSYHILSKHTVKLHLVAVCRYYFVQGSYCAMVLVFAQSTIHKCTETTKLLSHLLFIYLSLKQGVKRKKRDQKHESTVNLTCQLLHLLCIFRTRSGADFFRQFVSGSVSFQVQQKVSWELLDKIKNERMKKGHAKLLHP